MRTPLSSKVCPRCQGVSDVNTNFCGTCGADLRGVLPGDSKHPSSMPGRAPGSTAIGADDTPDWTGRLIDSRYRVLSLLGKGGMGAVYKVEHQRMGKLAAMKVLHRELTDDKEIARRFRREAEAVSKLSHPNTVATFDFGTWEGVMYLVMEYVRGEDLGAVLRRDGALAPKRAVPIFVQVLSALAEAHELGIVHRDLKPENLMIARRRDGGDFVKVLDFGLAKLSEREEDSATTGHGAIVGTPYYMSPEQIRGDDLDARADIYSLGAVMYRTLTGEYPFSAQTPMGVLTRHLTDRIVPLRERAPNLDIPAALEQIVLGTLSKDRESRPANVDHLREELELFFRLYGAGLSSNSAATAKTMPSLSAVSPLRPERRLPDESRPDEHMRREDFDEFERLLKRRAWLRLLFLPLFLALCVGGFFGYRAWNQKHPRAREVEPNHDLASATPIGLSAPVSGRIGRRLSDRKSNV